MMSRELTYEELTSLMKSCTGITVDPQRLRADPQAPLADIGLDSLGLLAIVSELEKRHGVQIDSGPETCKTPGDFLEAVNASLTVGA
ncbi:curamycin polyketide synthase [Streptomyces albus subsp. albus]|nr:curamycin polyketide synthase [Streptomyces albus subsp. albus]